MSLRGLYTLDPWARCVIAVGCVLAAGAVALSGFTPLSIVPLLLAAVVTYRPVPGGRLNLVSHDEREGMAPGRPLRLFRIATGVLFLAGLAAATTDRPALAAGLMVVTISVLLVGDILR